MNEGTGAVITGITRDDGAKFSVTGAQAIIRSVTRGGRFPYFIDY